MKPKPTSLPPLKLLKEQRMIDHSAPAGASLSLDKLLTGRVGTPFFMAAEATLLTSTDSMTPRRGGRPIQHVRKLWHQSTKLFC